MAPPASIVSSPGGLGQVQTVIDPISISAETLSDQALAPDTSVGARSAKECYAQLTDLSCVRSVLSLHVQAHLLVYPDFDSGHDVYATFRVDDPAENLYILSNVPQISMLSTNRICQTCAVNPQEMVMFIN